MTMQNRYHTVVAGFFLATTVICLGASPGRLHALEMGPALFMVQDVPPVASAPDVTITQPRIYYGLLGTNYTLVKTTTAEL